MKNIFFLLFLFLIGCTDWNKEFGREVGKQNYCNIIMHGKIKYYSVVEEIFFDKNYQNLSDERRKDKFLNGFFRKEYIGDNDHFQLILQDGMKYNLFFRCFYSDDVIWRSFHNNECPIIVECK
jgi:hypothetical protein